MSVQVSLSPEMESFIKGKVTSGSYDSATEVISDAIRRMQAEESRAAAWQAAIQLGDDQLDHGEGVAYDSAALANITQSALDAMRSGQAIDPDVLP